MAKDQDRLEMRSAIPVGEPPHDVKAEQAVIGGVILGESMMVDLMPMVDAVDFFMPANAEIWDAMVHLHKDDSPIDMVTLPHELRKRGVMQKLDGAEGYLMVCTMAVSVLKNAEHYAQIVKKTAVTRRAIMVASELVAQLYNGGDVDELMPEYVHRLGQASSDPNDDPVHLGDFLPRALEVIDEKQQQPALHFVRTGLRGFDRRFGGYQRQRLYMVASHPGGGKTSWAMDAAISSALEQGVPNLIFSLEMPLQELAERTIGSNTMVETRKIHRGMVSRDDWILMNKTPAIFKGKPIWIYDRPVGIDRICSIARRWGARHPGKLKLVTIDYLQIIRRGTQRGKSEAEMIGDITRESKLLAKDLDCPVVLLSQLNRESKKDRSDGGKPRKPRPEDLKGSGAIEADADVIIFTWPDPAADPTDMRIDAELLIGKNRGGPTGAIPAIYDRSVMKFSDRPRKRDMASSEDDLFDRSLRLVPEDPPAGEPPKQA